MGFEIEVDGGAAFATNINNEYFGELYGTFDVKSDHVTDIAFTDFHTLSYRQTGSSGLYEATANKYANSATVIMPVASPVGTNCIVIGDCGVNGFAVLYLNGSGIVYKFDKNGNTALVNLATVPGTKPTVAKGSPITVTKLVDRWVFTYVGYTGELLFSAIATLVTPVIGVLATTNAVNTFDFVINS